MSRLLLFGSYAMLAFLAAFAFGASGAMADPCCPAGCQKVRQSRAGALIRWATARTVAGRAKVGTLTLRVKAILPTRNARVSQDRVTKSPARPPVAGSKG
jgi:hypothetical protein